jgi:PKD repeat protein
MHVFGLATDVGQGRGSGTFTLDYADGSSQQVTVALQDWGYPGGETADHHIGIGPIPYRYNTQGRDGAPVPFHIYHAVVPIAAAQQLESITFPSTTTPPTGGSYPFAALYVMGLTFETAGGQFVAANLAGTEDEDTTAPVTTAQADEQPDGSVRVTLNATDEEGGSGVARTSYRLDGGGESTPYSEPFTVSAPGDHTVEYWSVDAAGNEEAAKSIEFTIEEPTDPDAPSVEGFADPSSGAAPLLVQFSATGLDPQGGLLTYEWDFGDGGGSFNQSPQHTYTAPGTYTARVTATDPQGKTGTDTVEVVVTAQGNQAPTVRATSDPRSGAAPLRVSFSALASDPDGPASDLTYLWDFDDGGVNGFGRNAHHTYMEPGTYTATVTVTDRHGAFDTAEVVVTVADPPGNIPPTVTAAAAPRSGTAPLRVSFTSAATDPDGDQVSTVWDFGDGVRAGGADIAHTYTAPGTYTATVTVRDPGGLTDTDSVQITVTGSSGQGAAPQGSPPGDGGTVEATSAPRVRAPKAMKARQVIRRGVRLKISCEQSCRARSVLRISGERIGASKRLQIGAGVTRTLVARLKGNVRRNLLAAMRQAGVKRVTITAITTITTDDVSRAFPVKITLRR